MNTKLFTWKMDAEGEVKLKQLQDRLQARAEPEVNVTQRYTIMRALIALEKQLDRQDRMRESHAKRKQQRAERERAYIEKHR